MKIEIFLLNICIVSGIIVVYLHKKNLFFRIVHLPYGIKPVYNILYTVLNNLTV
jgi:hypothetical protein